MPCYLGIQSAAQGVQTRWTCVCLAVKWGCVGGLLTTCHKFEMCARGLNIGRPAHGAVEVEPAAVAIRVEVHGTTGG